MYLPYLCVVDIWPPPRLRRTGGRRLNNSISDLCARQHMSKLPKRYLFIPYSRTSLTRQHNRPPRYRPLKGIPSANYRIGSVAEFGDYFQATTRVA
jgi:hypothetical protein